VLERLERRTSQTRIAVVGASNNPEKYGNIIVRNLMGKGFTVLPVNPREPQVEGLTAYPSLRDVPTPVDVVDIVTPPAVTLAVLREAAECGIKAVFLQDGSFDDAVLAFAATAPFKTVYNACIMVVT
jgi:predicted CoA-binding protein